MKAESIHTFTGKTDRKVISQRQPDFTALHVMKKKLCFLHLFQYFKREDMYSVLDSLISNVKISDN